MPTTQNMGLTLPTVTETTGPEWASQLNLAITAIDSHDHSTGKGVKITPLGLNINADLSMSSNNLIATKSIRFSNQSALLQDSADLRSLYVSSNNLYYNNESGTAVRIITGEFLDGTNIGGLTASKAIETDSTGAVVSSDVTSTELGYLSGVTSAIQTQLDAKVTNPLTTDGDIIVQSSDSPARLALGSANTVLKSNGTAPSWGSIVDADIDASAAITRSKLKSGTASHVVIHDASGNLSSEAQLAKSRGGSGQDNSSLTFPSSGTLATLAGSESLSNKTISDSLTFTEQTSTPSSPSSGSKKLYAKNDGKVYTLDSNGIEKEVGSGAGGSTVDQDFETDIGDAAVYNDGGAFVDGTGGTASVFSVALNQTSPLVGDQDLKITKDAADGSGEGVTLLVKDIDVAYRGRAHWLTFEWSPDSDYSPDLAVKAYDVTNSAELVVETDGNLPARSGLILAKILTDSDTAEIRVCLHCETDNSTAAGWTAQVDQISLNIDTPVPGFIGSEWQTSTATSSWTTNTTTTCKLKRLGDETIFEFNNDLTGEPDDTGLYFNLPAGYEIDTDKLTGNATSFYVEGSGNANRDVTGVRILPLYKDTTSVYVAYSSSATAEVLVGKTAPVTWASGDNITVRVRLPIKNQKATTLLSSFDQNVSAIAVRYSTDAAQSIPNNTATIIDFEDKSFDEFSTVTTGSSWKFTAPRKGYYKVHAQARFGSASWNAGTEQIQLLLYKNGSQYSYLDIWTAESTVSQFVRSVNGDDIILLDKDDYIDVRVLQSSGSSLSLQNLGALNYVTVESINSLTHTGSYFETDLIESSNGTLANYSITAGEWGDLTNIELPPGEYDIDVITEWYSNGATTMQNIGCGLSTNSGNDSTDLVLGDNLTYIKKDGASGDRNQCRVSKRGVRVTSASTYYLKAYSDSPTTNLQVAYKISARKVD